jgi:hypothetical protein
VHRFELYPFEYRDRITGKWVRARHRLQMPELQRQYAEWEITGPTEIRHVTGNRQQRELGGTSLPICGKHA